MPVRKQSKTAKSALRPATCWYVISDISAVGPIVISLQLPNKQYTMQPANAEYRPYCKTWKKKSNNDANKS